MKLSDWITAQGGCAVLSRKMNLDLSTVYKWSIGKAIPTVKNMVRIEKLSKGKVTLAEMVRGAACK